MGFSTYGALKGEVAAWLRRTDLDAEIAGFIALAEAQISRRLRSARMLAEAALTTTAGAVDLPSDFAAARSVSLADGPGYPLGYAAPETAAAFCGLGPPQAFTLKGGRLVLTPPGAGTLALTLVYYARLAALSDAAPSNWLLASHPDAYLYGALVQSAPFLRADERLGTWASLFSQILDDINASDAGPGAALAITPNTYRAEAL